MIQKQKILLAFILPAITALLAVWLFVDRSHQQLSIERWSSEHQALVRAIAHSTQEKISDASSLLAYTSRLPDFSALSAVDRINPALNGIPPDLEPGKRQILDSLLAGESNLAVLFLLLPNGDHYLSHPYAVQQSLKKYNLADRPYFQEATRSKKMAVSDTISGADGMPAVVIDTPLLNPTGEIYAHLGGVLYLKHLSRLLSSADIAPFDYGLLADRKGMLIGHSDANLIGGLRELQKAEHAMGLFYSSPAASAWRWPYVLPSVGKAPTINCAKPTTNWNYAWRSARQSFPLARRNCRNLMTSTSPYCNVFLP